MVAAKLFGYFFHARTPNGVKVRLLQASLQAAHWTGTLAERITVHMQGSVWPIRLRKQPFVGRAIVQDVYVQT